MNIGTNQPILGFAHIVRREYRVRSNFFHLLEFYQQVFVVIRQGPG
jgi:hypothetical protein